MISVAMLRIVIALPNNDGLYLQYLFWTELTWSPVLKGKKKKQVGDDFLLCDDHFNYITFLEDVIDVCAIRHEKSVLTIFLRCFLI